MEIYVTCNLCFPFICGSNFRFGLKIGFPQFLDLEMTLNIVFYDFLVSNEFLNIGQNKT